MGSSESHQPTGNGPTSVAPSARRPRVAWLGASSGGLAWLQQRLQAFRSARVDEVQLSVADELSIDQVRGACEAGAERLILACSRRLDYPLREVEWITTHCPEIPLALATSTWWEGTRRTGLGELPHVAMPWHRWWDGWVDWIDATTAELFGPCILPSSYHGNGTDRLPENRSLGARLGERPGLGLGWIVADCWQTGQAWRFAAEQAGAAVEVKNSAHLVERRGVDAVAERASAAKIDWVLWDDSCLTTTAGSPELGQCLAAVEFARRAAEPAHLCCAFSIPRWHVWERLQRSGADELLTKPNTGRGLRRMLVDWHRHKSLAADPPAKSPGG